MESLVVLKQLFLNIPLQLYIDSHYMFSSTDVWFPQRCNNFYNNSATNLVTRVLNDHYSSQSVAY